MSVSGKQEAGLPCHPSVFFPVSFVSFSCDSVRHEALSISVGENPMQVIGLSLGRREDDLSGDVKDRSSSSRSVGRNVST